MSEKLYLSHCRVAGHGTKCVVAKDIYPDKKSLSKLRRARDKEEIFIQLLEDSIEYLELEDKIIYCIYDPIPMCDCELCAEEYWKKYYGEK